MFVLKKSIVIVFVNLMSLFPLNENTFEMLLIHVKIVIKLKVFMNSPRNLTKSYEFKRTV